MSEHTPGPWAIRENGEGYFADVNWWEDDAHQAYWITGPRFIEVGEDMYAFTKSDATLIAAAPDLLAAAEALSDEVIHEVSRDHMCRIPGEALLQLRAAIAKATGAEVPQ